LDELRAVGNPRVECARVVKIRNALIPSSLAPVPCHNPGHVRP